MSRQRQTQEKTLSNFSTLPVQSGFFRQRPFTDPAEPDEVSPAQHEKQNPHSQTERATHFGYNFSQLQVHNTKPAVLQRKSLPGNIASSEKQETNQALEEASTLQWESSSSGSPLPPSIRQKMEAVFATDFSDVQIYQGPEAKSIGAIAYAQSSDIHFAPGEYDPTSHPGQEILGHELAHVVQQRAGRVAVPQGDGVPINADPTLEAEADVLGAKAARGEAINIAETNQGTSQGNQAATSAVQRYPDSDYVRELMGTSRPGGPIAGPNDAVMAPKHNGVSDAFNWGVTEVMDLVGYDTRQRPAREDNDFYRDYAQYMPGYDIDGIPSGAWAQNAATNHVGHGMGPGNPWDNVRKSLVSQEKATIDADLAAGGTGQLSYWDLYDAHVNAYDHSGGGGNGFIDPGSFALAVYGAPMLEAVGIDSGPITGASIDIFNNPEDSATEGWLKRMGLAGAEIAGGVGLAGAGLGNIAEGNIITGGAEALSGIGMAGLGAFGAGWNTASAIDHGMLNEWGTAISDTASDVWDGTKDIASDAWDWLTD